MARSSPGWLLIHRRWTEAGESPRKTVRCCNCGNVGHTAMQCPDTALFLWGMGGLAIIRSSVVESRAVKGILLDTGCSRMMVRRCDNPRFHL